MLLLDYRGLTCRSKDYLELDFCKIDDGGFAPLPEIVVVPELSWSREEKVGLKVLTDEMGGLLSFPPKELEAVVDISAPVAPSDVAPPGFSLSYLFK